LTRHTTYIKPAAMSAVKVPHDTPPERVLPRHRFGAHLSIAGGVHHALLAAQKLRCDVVQVFVKNQRQWRAAPLDPDDLQQWHALRTTPGFGPVVAHATYLINLAAADAGLYANSREAFAQELRRCQILGIPYLVVHPGSRGDASPDVAMARVSKALNRIFSENADLTTMPLLETTAGQGTALGRTFEELGEIARGLDEPHRVGICIDTCHVFAAGYDIRRPEVYRDMIDLAAQTVGLDRIRCWHLNDSKGDCGSHLDRHVHIGHGQLGTVAFRNLLSDRRFVGVPMILETPKGTDDAGRDLDAVNLRRLRTMATRVRR
jgi:deoxyribonuclease-4